MNKFTPGPWFISEGDPLEIHSTDPRETIVANVSGPHSNASALADARLIAAAPEMAELLEMIDTHYGGSLDHRPPYVAKARALLAKVEGK